MGESFLRTSNDIDAPPLNPNKGSFISVLQAVLVDGYGSTPGLGWTLEFTGTNTAVFRNQGTRTFVRFDHNTKDNTVYMRAYESMNDVDNGFLTCPYASKSFYLKLANDGASVANLVPWRILGDDKGIWVLLNNYYGNNNSSTSPYTGCFEMWYIGDYIPFDISNTYNFGIFQSTENDSDGRYMNWQSWNMSNFGDIRDDYQIIRDPSGIPGAIQVGLSSGSGYETARFGWTPNICDSTSDFQLTSIPMIHSTDKIIGRLPGLKNSLSQCGNHGGGFSNLTELDFHKPEMTFDFGDYKEHFWRGGSQYDKNIWYFVLTEGKGFRNVA